jgi:hypothetical protein
MGRGRALIEVRREKVRLGNGLTTRLGTGAAECGGIFYLIYVCIYIVTNAVNRMIDSQSKNRLFGFSDTS